MTDALRGARRRRLARILPPIALVVIVAVVAGAAILAQGYDVKRTPLRSPFVWAVNQAQASGAYARVNTDLGELDTVQNVQGPSGVVQSGDAVVLLASKNQKYASVDVASPQDFGPEGPAADDLKSLPPSADFEKNGTWVVTISDTDGTVQASTVDDTGLSSPVTINPDDHPAANAKPYTAEAVAVSASGELFAYSATAGRVLRYDLTERRVLGEDAVTDAPKGAGLQLTAAGDQWMLYEPGDATQRSTDRVWTRSSPTPTTLPQAWTSARVQAASAASDSVLVAHQAGLARVSLDDGSATEIGTGDATIDGTPSQPMQFDGTTYAAWVTANAASSADTGWLWSSEKPTAFTSLSGAGSGTLRGSSSPAPAFLDNGSAIALNDASNGWVWTVPDGRIVPSSQDWTLGEQTHESTSNDSTPQDPTREVPPQARNDRFGVRAGALVSLPVLLNDSDANGDVLTIVPGSITGLATSFGTASITTDLGRIAVRVAKGVKAGQSATFTYKVSDGFKSTAASVRLTVSSDSAETAPVWCGVDDCLAEWPSLQVTPGGSGRAAVLNGWVDPEGDSVFVKSARLKDASAAGSVAVTEDGEVFFQSPSASGGAGSIPVVVTVADARGREVDKELDVRVTGTPALAAASFSVETYVGRSTTIDPAPYISDVAGAFRIPSAPSVSDAAAKVAVGAAGTTMTFSSDTAGSYVVSYDVSDRKSGPVTGQVRVTVLDDADAGLAAAPITVFVRPHLDSTVDVLDAVSNPAGSLLSLTAAVPDQSPGASLDAEAVDHRMLRVTGSTGDGAPGVVGSVDYTVTDDAGGSVTGVATVVLLDGGTPDYPIALDDSATVRAGAQLDVPVLDNDVSSDGYALELDPTPDAVNADFGDGLAFVSGNELRLLAPDQAGTYTVSYTVYSAGDPTRSDTANVTITVVPTGRNSAPKPTDLETRVIQGQTAQVPFDAFGVDPDGDRVVLSRIVTQPKHGVASIDADGTSLVYTAIDATYDGPDSFQYEVTDPEGAVGRATVHVGVLSTDTATAPVTLTDYVQAQTGPDSVVTVSPLSNDSDPLGYDLQITCLEPDVPGACGTAGVAGGGGADVVQTQRELASLLDWRKGSATARIRTGTDAGTKVYVYTATAKGNDLRSSTGYIVLDAVSEVIPDAPKVPDTVLGVKDRATFERDGVDVLSRASWLTGDVASLEITSLDKAYTADGRTLRGPLPAQTTIVPFEAKGRAAGAKDDSVTYGFLVIPGEDSVILALGDTTTRITVKENSSASFDIADLVPVPSDRTLQVGTGIKAQLRPEATCKPAANGSDITYTAGSGEPWGDSCLVPVRLDGQKYYTDILVPIQVQPEKPVPSFLPGPSLTVAPDQTKTQTVDLSTLVHWVSVNTDDADLTFTAVGPGGSAWKFRYDSAKKTVVIGAKGTALPGTQGRIEVAFSGKYASTGDHTIISLKVGPTPNVTPRGGIVVTPADACRSPQAHSCEVTVVGVPGEDNYFAADGPLELAKVIAGGECPGVTFQAVGTTRIRATWSGDIDGMTCKTRFAVRDPSAAHHLSPPDKYGTVTWQFQARPRAVTDAYEYSYDTGTITFRITPPKQRPIPATQSYHIVGPGVSQDCAARGTGTVDCAIHTQKDLDPQSYKITAVNAVSSSPAFSIASAWSYPKLSIGRAQAQPVYDSNLTGYNVGAAEFTVGGFDESVVTGFEVTDGNYSSRQNTGSDPTTFRLQLGVGQHTLTVTPITAMGPPDGAIGPRASDASRQVDVQVAGRPSISRDGQVTQATTDQITLAGSTIDSNGSRLDDQILRVAWRNGASRPQCSFSPANGTVSVSGDAIVSTSEQIRGIEAYGVYNVAICASNGYGAVDNFGSPDSVWANGNSNTFPDILYTVSSATLDANGRSTDGVYALHIDPSQVKLPSSQESAYWKNYDPSKDTASNWDRDPSISVDYCLTNDNRRCEQHPPDVKAADGHAQYQVSIGGSQDLTCTPGQTLKDYHLDDRNGGNANRWGDLAIASVSYIGIDGKVIAGATTDQVPLTATSVTVAFVYTFTKNEVSALAPYTWSITHSCP